MIPTVFILTLLGNHFPRLTGARRECQISGLNLPTAREPAISETIIRTQATARKGSKRTENDSQARCPWRGNSTPPHPPGVGSASSVTALLYRIKSTHPATKCCERL